MKSLSAGDLVPGKQFPHVSSLVCALVSLIREFSSHDFGNMRFEIRHRDRGPNW